METRTRRRRRPPAETPTVAGRQRDPLERLIEGALLPGTFVGYDESWGFVTGLEAVRAEVRSVIEARQGQRAVPLLELFIAGCYEKAEEIDDSSGDFGSFVATLFCDWIRARQGVDAPAPETVRILLSWMERDDYGFCHRLEDAAVEVLDRAGLAALEQSVQAPTNTDSERPSPPDQRNAILKAIHRTRRDVASYAASCEEAGGPTPADCETLAEMSMEHRRAEDALAWAERGLALEARPRTWGNGAAQQLPRLRRAILTQLGRNDEALSSAWQAYLRAPSAFSYGDLMQFVAKDAHAEWHERALGALDGANPGSRMGLFLATREWVRLAEAVEAASRSELASLSHTLAEPIATRLRRSHPLLAARLHTAMAVRILDARKSAHYDAALGNLETARRLLLREGRAEEWRALAEELRTVHRRKSSFLSGFDRIDAGRSAREPSFRTRARRRWRRQAGAKSRWTW